MLPVLALAAALAVSPGTPRTWGNATFVDLAVGGSHRYLGKTSKLISSQGDSAVVDVDGVRAELTMARRALPIVLNGVRVFLADNRTSAELTVSSSLRSARRTVTRDAILC